MSRPAASRTAWWEPAAEDEHYTRVTLEHIHDDYNTLLDAKELVLAVRTSLPATLGWKPATGDIAGSATCDRARRA